ncbi:MAG: class I SAM-dependent methyltransferase [Pseudomonadota bacterium]
MTAPFRMNSFQGKQVLALVRDGDYAHAGEEEAIEQAMAAFPKDPARRILDAGCGRGGTAAYLQAHGWGQVTGFDREADSIPWARERYPHVTFHDCDLYHVAGVIQGPFDMVTLFNVLYALPERARALEILAGLTAPAGRLMIFDYVDPGNFPDSDSAHMTAPELPPPPKLADLPDLLAAGGWRLDETQELHAPYERWYADLVARIEAKRPAIEDLAGAEGYTHVHETYADMLHDIRQGTLGGAIVYARKA